MHVLIVSPYFYPSWHYGGPPRVAFESAKALVQAGHQVTVYTTDTFNRHERIQKETDEIEGVKIHYFRNRSNAFSSHFLYFNPMNFQNTLRDKIRNFDFVHIHEYRTHMSYWAAKIARENFVPCVLQPHGGLANIAQRNHLKRIFDLLYGNWILHNVDGLIALNEYECELARNKSISEERIFLLPNGVDPQWLSVKLNQNPIKPTILYMGRIHHNKGCDLILEALNLMRDDHFQMIFSGPDFGYTQPLKNRIHQLNLSQNIQFTGFVEGETQLNIYRSADVLVLPSRNEGFGLVIVEAMASGIPVVISRACHMPQVTAYGAGLEVDLNPNDIAQALKFILNLPSIKKMEMGQNGKRLVREEFLKPILVEKLIGIYKKVSAAKA